MGDQQRDEFMYPETDGAVATTKESPLQALLARPSQAGRSREHETKENAAPETGRTRTIELCALCKLPRKGCPDWDADQIVRVQIPESMTDAAYMAAHYRGEL